MLDSMFIDSTADSYINVDLGLYGGFFGWELRRCERDPEANETVLHGGANALRGVTVCGGLTSATVVDGFTITDYRDGAVKCADSSPVISGNKITANLTTAIECTGAGETPLIRSNLISYNAVSALNTYGGGCTPTAPPQ